ncbi:MULTISPECIES: ComF family protein [Acinetobacter]|uniref:ComF family protein n=1 Tax=Acinetobacter TaxID=469 RepID=UPI0004D81B2E|nr:MULTISPECIES: phosphoribosyltransferase family protein [unclassified Acinetobacter]KEC84309.1 competence protein ComF [Acinetobacter sp. ETR1]WEE39966.1 phosphoribosyltransferase family protein [Acinetobacter sp. TAC-1]
MLQFINRVLHKSVQSLSPCLLCGTDRQQQHSLCNTCWNELPWYKQHIERHQHQIVCAHRYDFPIDRIIQVYKYEQQLQYQTLLAQSLLNLSLPKIQAIVPMPISTARLKERGYNQMLIIAKIMARQLNIPVWQPVIREAQHSQKGLSRIERLENIEYQFKMIKTEKRKYKKVLIIDDVVTTGSSIHALTHALENLGCQQIYSVCIAAAQ